MSLFIPSSPVNPSVEVVRMAFDEANGSTKHILDVISQHRSGVPVFFKAEPMYLFTFCRCVEGSVIEAMFEAGVDFKAIEKSRAEPPCLAQAMQNPNPEVFGVLLDHGLDPLAPFWKDTPKDTVLNRCISEDRIQLFKDMIDRGVKQAPEQALLKKAPGCLRVLLDRDKRYLKHPVIVELAKTDAAFKSIYDHIELEATTIPASRSNNSMRL